MFLRSEGFGVRQRADMEANRDIHLVIKLLIFSSLFSTSAGSNVLGYQFLNVSRMPYCFSLPNNDQCPTTLINYKIPDLDSSLVSTDHLLTIVNTTLNSLQFFLNVNATCRQAVQEYACSNTLPICRTDPNTPWGIAINFDVNRTKRACAAAKASCPKDVIAASILNCVNIMDNPMELMTCAPLPAVPGDACANTNYKVTEVYPVLSSF